MKQELSNKLLLKFGDASETIMDYLDKHPNLGLDKIEKIETTPNEEIVMSYNTKIGLSDAGRSIIIRKGDKDDIIIEKNLKALKDDNLIVEYETSIIDKKGIEKERSEYHDSLQVEKNTNLRDISMNEYNPHPNDNKIYNCTPRVFNNPTYVEISRHDENPTVATLHITEMNKNEKKKSTAIVSCWDDRDPLGLHINKGGRFDVYFLYDLAKGGYIVPNERKETQEEVKKDMEREKELFIEDLKTNHPELVDIFIEEKETMEK